LEEVTQAVIVAKIVVKLYESAQNQQLHQKLGQQFACVFIPGLQATPSWLLPSFSSTKLLP